MENATIDSWDNIVKNYLKAEHLKSKSGSFVCDDIKVIQSTRDDGTEVWKLEIETTIDDITYIFQPNYTNTTFIKSKIDTPKELIGKKLFYEKGKARNPKTNAQVDSIVLTDIQ